MYQTITQGGNNMSKKKFLLSVVSLFFVLSIISVTSLKTALAENKGHILETDVVYGKGGDTELKLDIAYPKQGEGPFPALVFIFGGGWIAGVRQQYSYEIVEAAEKGYVALTIDYRLLVEKENGKPKYPFPAQVHDGKCAVRWLRANATTYKIDPDHIGVVGYSVGAHLALMLGLTDVSGNLEGECGQLDYSSRVQAVVSLSGFSDLVYWDNVAPGGFIEFLGGTFEEVPEQYIAASPVNHVSKDDPPVLSIHGEEDMMVPVKQAKLLDAKMKEVGASHILLIIKGVGHVALVNDTVWNFLDEHLKGK
jgi:acetyl esterase/lipase